MAGDDQSIAGELARFRHLEPERAALVCGAPLRAALADLIARFGLILDVYAYGELPPALELRPLVVLESPRPQAISA